MKELQQLVQDEIVHTTDIPQEYVTQHIERSNREDLGMFSLPLFQLAREKQSNPIELGKNYSQKNWKENLLVNNANGFLNIDFTPNYLSNTVINTVLEEKEKYGSINIGDGKTAVIDFSSPNIGKPMHVGHIRSTILGDSLGKILKFAGYKTVGINYLGDVGLHLGKTIRALELWGNEDELAQNPDEYILELYSNFCKKEETNPKLTKQAQQVVKQIEENNPKYTNLLQLIHEKSMEAFERVYNVLDVSFDEITGQKYYNTLGKEFVKKALDDGKAYTAENGGVIVNLDEYGLEDKVILRSDGTAIYATQDLGAAVDRKERYDFDEMLYVVANEQETYFNQIFSILDKMGYSWADNCKHVSFGMINFEDGKISSRKGNTILLEELLSEAVSHSKKNLDERNSTVQNIEELAHTMGVGAIKHMILSIDYKKDIQFSWERALDMNSNGAPYIQYSHARAKSLLEKLNSDEAFDPTLLSTTHEQNLIKKISQLPSIVRDSVTNKAPHLIANYGFELSDTFNKFYHNVTVSEEEFVHSRLALVNAYKQTINNAMNLLGIKLPDNI